MPHCQDSYISPYYFLISCNSKSEISYQIRNKPNEFTEFKALINLRIDFVHGKCLMNFVRSDSQPSCTDPTTLPIQNTVNNHFSTFWLRKSTEHMNKQPPMYVEALL